MRTFAAFLGFLALQERVSPDLLEYQPTGRLEGTLQLGPTVGFEKLVSRWVERIKQHYPDLRGGHVESNLPTTPAALTSGAYPLGMLTRRWTGTEAAYFRFLWGFSPTEVMVGADAVAIVVNANNPIRAMLVEDVDATFSSTRRRGGRPVRTWGDLGLQGDWKDQPINVYGLGKDSAARTAFQEKALSGGTFHKNLREVSGIDAVLAAVADDPFAMGYVNGTAHSDRCRLVPLRPSADSPAVDPQAESILSLSYPLSWRIYVSLRKTPGSSMDPLINEFVKMMLSKDGQEILAGEGMVPITGRMASRELKKLR